MKREDTLGCMNTPRNTNLLHRAHHAARSSKPKTAPTLQARHFKRERQAGGGVQVQPAQCALRQRLLDEQGSKRGAAAGIVLQTDRRRGSTCAGWLAGPDAAQTFK